MTRLKPGERQVIRVRVKPAGDAEQAYRLIVNELPDAKSDRRDGVQFRFSFSVPVFTSSSPETAAASGLSWSLSGSTLTVRNAGSSRAKLSALRLVAPSGSEIPVAGGNLVYVLAGASMQWQVGAPPGGAGFRVKGRDDRSGHDIEAAVGRS
jgi:fimbrial chaperone protein